MVVYGFAIFSSAFLLFEVQPLLGKYILPSFGGAAAVWTSCLLTFQLLLLVGYAYAYLLARWLPPRAQILVHLLLLLAALGLPIAPDSTWKPNGSADPTWQIVELLALCVGLPFIALSATTPLLQHWRSLRDPGGSLYHFYALSNLGSQLALLSYPLLLEPLLGRAKQILLWRAGLFLFAVSCAWAAMGAWRASPLPTSKASRNPTRPGATDQALWILLPGCGSLLLAAVTGKICQELTPIPLLWVLPLSAYLLSFILCFNQTRIYDRRWFAPLLLAALALMALTLSGTLDLSARAQALVLLGGLFICCMVCHGELFRLRPEPAHLTWFYLLIGAGGALGTFCVAAVAPRIFKDYFELHWGLMLCAGLAALGWWRESRTGAGWHWLRLGWLASMAAVVGLGLALWNGAHANDRTLVFRSRDFYGVLSVYRHATMDPGKGLAELVHGQVVHGVQFLQPERSQTPTLYYTTGSGVGTAFSLLPQHGPRRIGVVGLGTGTLAAYARIGDQLTFYELNPTVEKIATTYFTFLQACAGQARVQLGDGRLALESEPEQNFDLLVLDAFNSDSIPVHLLTHEAFATYQRHTKPKGMIAVHVSNVSLNLEPIVLKLASAFGYTARVIEQPLTDESEGLLPSSWVLLSQIPYLGEALPAQPATDLATNENLNGPLWTDDYNSVLPVMRWRDIAADTLTTSKSARATLDPKRAKAALIIARWRKELASNPESPVILNNLACLLATAPDPQLRSGAEAVKLAEKACALTRYHNGSALTTLAAAYAEAGRFDEAVAASEKACALATENGETALIAGNRQMLEYFRNKRPFHQPAP
ncbi:MAG TPA: fused MFS/spermidine synthase [Verrucomicrobiae bacterium]|nr:fused MFS/spermidine synthase [Verrucomicrobiae bacterium]